MPHPFTYANGELGLTGKMKRRAILERHASCIGSMYVHREMHAFNSKCEANMVPQPHQKHVNLSQIKEEDEGKASRNSSRHNSPMQQTRRCQSQILLKSKYKLSSREQSENPRDSPDLSSSSNGNDNKETTKTSDTNEKKPINILESDSEEEDEEGVDPEVKEKERKTSEQRIMQIVHYDGPLKEKGGVLPNDGIDVSNTNTPTTPHKNNNGEGDGLSEVNLSDEHKNEDKQREERLNSKEMGRKISDNFSEDSSTVAINSQKKLMR